MNIKDMLITSLAVLQAENMISTHDGDHGVIRSILNEVKLPDYVDEDDERSSLLTIKDVVTEILDGQMEFNKTILLKRIKLACTQNMSLYDSVVDYLDIEKDLPEEQEKRIDTVTSLIQSYYFRLTQMSKMNAVMQTMGKAFGALKGTETRVDTITALTELRESITNFTERTNKRVPSLVSALSSSDHTHFIKIFQNIQDKAQGNGLKTGWQDINKMMGVNGGLGEEMWLMPALPHNCKSLFSLALSTSVVVFNKPDLVMKDIKGDLKPIILDLSLENEHEVNIANVYQMLYGHFEGKEPDMANGNLEEMAKYVTTHLEKNGWGYEFEKHTNDNFKVQYFNDIISDRRRRGEHVVGIRADYLGTINKAGHGNGIAGSDIKEIYRMARNIQVVKNRGFMLAPHQISPDGKRLRALDEDGFIRNAPGKGLYDNCTSLDNEADGEMYANRRVIEGRAFLEIMRGKHRTIIDTNPKHYYTVIPFGLGILPWDVDREAKTTANSINHFTGGMGSNMFDDGL